MPSLCRRLLAQKRKQDRKDALRRQKLGQRRKAMHAERKAKIAVLQVCRLPFKASEAALLWVPCPQADHSRAAT